jgi:hypothetical protein
MLLPLLVAVTTAIGRLVPSAAFVPFVPSVTLYAGLGGKTPLETAVEFGAFAANAHLGSISAAATLLYAVGNDSTLTWQTSPAFQRSLTAQLGLSSTPCVYCDMTQGVRCQLPPHDEATFLRSTLDAARDNGWHGYTVDVEGADDDRADAITAFLVRWATTLVRHRLTLNVWVGEQATQFTPGVLERAASDDLLTLTSMDTYDTDASGCQTFVDTAELVLGGTTARHRYQFGILTPDGGALMPQGPPQNVTDCIVDWARRTGVGGFGVWASVVPPTWMLSLRRLVNDP